MIPNFLSKIFPEPRPFVLAISIIVVFGLSAYIGLTHYLSDPPVTRLQRRITSARSGAVVRIEPGIYSERVQIRESITLMPSEGKGTVTISSILIEGNAEVTVRDIWTYGVQVRGSAVVLLEDVRASGSKLCLSVSDHSQVHAKRCVFAASIFNGCKVTDQAQLRAEDCRLSGNLRAGIAAEDAAVVDLHRCQISSNRMIGVTLEDDASVTMYQCHVIQTGDELTPSELKRLSDWGSGIQVRDSAELNVIDCQISANARNGIEVNDTASVDIESAIISENGDLQAFRIDSDATGSDDTRPSGSYGLGILISGESSVSLSGCEISNNLRGGIALYNSDCIGEQTLFEDSDALSVKFVGKDNQVASPGTPGGNREFDCCPTSLCSETD